MPCAACLLSGGVKARVRVTRVRIGVRVGAKLGLGLRRRLRASSERCRDCAARLRSSEAASATWRLPSSRGRRRRRTAGKRRPAADDARGRAARRRRPRRPRGWTDRASSPSLVAKSRGAPSEVGGNCGREIWLEPKARSITPNFVGLRGGREVARARDTPHSGMAAAEIAAYCASSDYAGLSQYCENFELDLRHTEVDLTASVGVYKVHLATHPPTRPSHPSTTHPPRPTTRVATHPTTTHRSTRAQPPTPVPPPRRSTSPPHHH